MTIRSFSFPQRVRGALAVPLITSLASLSTGCGDGGTSGAMTQSSTRPVCAANDAACQSDGLDAPLAVGARLPLDVHITARGVAAPKLALEAVREDVLAVDPQRAALIGRAAGWSSVVFVEPEGLALDFITLSVEAPERIEAYRLDDGGGAEASPLPARIQLAPGDDLEIAVKPFAGATRLLGELDAAWNVDVPIVTLLDSGRPASRRLRVKQVGSAKLTIEAAGFTKTIDLEVLP